MTDRLVIALAQLNPTVGAVGANRDKARAAWEKAKAAKADLVLYSELYLCGYPPEDLVLQAVSGRGLPAGGGRPRRRRPPMDRQS